MAEHRQESGLERVADRVEIVSGSSTSASTSSSEGFTLQLVSEEGSEFLLINGHNSREDAVSSSTSAATPLKREIKQGTDHLSSFEVESTIDCDIYSFPVARPHTSEDRVLAIDDLHGNYLKLLRFLLEENVVSLNEAYWDFLVVLYKKAVKISGFLAKNFAGSEITLSEEDDFSTKELRLFSKIMRQIKPTGYGPKIIPGGDDVGDRGGNDFFTLAFLQRLKEIEVIPSIPVSNHGYVFMKVWEKSQAKDRALSLKVAIRKLISKKSATFFASLLGLQYLLEKGLVDPEEVNAMVQNYYSMLQIFDYTINAAGNEIVIFSHTIIDHVRLGEVAEVFGQKYIDTSAAAIALSIDYINQAFQKISKTDFIQLLDGRADSNKILDKLIWVRRHEELPATSPLPHDIQMINVHGHTSPAGARKYRHPLTGILYVNLHSKFGMPRSSEDPIRFVSRDQGLTPAKRAEMEQERAVLAQMPPARMLSEFSDSTASFKREEKVPLDSVIAASAAKLSRKTEKRKVEEAVESISQGKKNKTDVDVQQLVPAKTASASSQKMLAETSRLFPALKSSKSLFPTSKATRALRAFPSSSS